MRNDKLYSALALAGTLPFIASALLLLLGTNRLPVLGLVDAVVASYGLAIVCFLAADAATKVPAGAIAANFIETSSVLYAIHGQISRLARAISKRPGSPVGGEDEYAKDTDSARFTDRCAADCLWWRWGRRRR